MDGGLFGIVVGLIGLVFIVPVIALYKAAKAKRIAKQAEERLPELTARVYALERQVMKLSELGARPETPPPAPPFGEASATSPPRVPAEPPKVPVVPSVIPLATTRKPEPVPLPPLPPPRFEAP